MFVCYQWVMEKKSKNKPIRLSATMSYDKKEHENSLNRYAKMAKNAKTVTR